MKYSLRVSLEVSVWISAATWMFKFTAFADALDFL